ncbi:ABC transporter permease [Herbidospora mongoliensis]|uniref:ABC transporter permease n=1 Tax=Herbidospora mongoliensis TaxID=688067 RepID=UPI00157CAC28|nr:ABC transporter permease [Herbidospora mongoliensis]
MESSSLIALTPALPLALVLLVAGGAGVAAAGGLGYGWAVVRACLRGVLQLGVVSLIIAWVVANGLAVAGFILVMYAFATHTAAKRIGTYWAALPVAAGSAPVLGVLTATGAVTLDGMVIIPVTGIVFGGCLIATSLAGRRAADELTTRHGEVEAAMSLGFTPRDARLEICRPAAAQALVPALDQTRTVGLVTLPGAFVGMLIGGATPVEAGIVQLVVLVALLSAEAFAVVLTIELAARGRLIRP